MGLKMFSILDMLLDYSEPEQTNDCPFCGSHYCNYDETALTNDEFDLWDSLRSSYPNHADYCPVCDGIEIRRLLLESEKVGKWDNAKTNNNNSTRNNGNA